MTLVQNEEKYWEFIRKLRNDIDIQSGFVEQVHISEEDQQKYMYLYEKCYYICLNNSEPVGYIGEINNDIRLAVSKEYQRRGIGKFMLNEFMNIIPNCVAKVKHDNAASKYLFESCGFTCTGRDNDFYYYKR